MNSIFSGDRHDPSRKEVKDGDVLSAALLSMVKKDMERSAMNEVFETAGKRILETSVVKIDDKVATKMQVREREETVFLLVLIINSDDVASPVTDWFVASPPRPRQRRRLEYRPSRSWR